MKDTFEKPEQELILYRYYGAIKRDEPVCMEKLQELFINCKLKFSSPNDFNDPFDCKSFTFTLEGVKKGEAITWIQNNWVKPNFPAANSTERREIAEHIYDDFNSGKETDMAEKTSKDIYTQIPDDFLICCFSEIPDSILMWAHYAAGHRGFCIKCRFKRDLKIDATLANVAYPDDDCFPEINPILYLQGRDDAVAKMFFVKSKHWKYEGEWRMIKKNDGNQYEQQLPDVLQGVIFGLKMQDEDKTQIRAWLKQGKSNPEYYQAERVKGKFALSISPIK
jgi:hypothetical protein